MSMTYIYCSSAMSTTPSTTRSDHFQRELVLPIMVTMSAIFFGAMITTATIIIWMKRIQLLQLLARGSAKKKWPDTANSIDLGTYMQQTPVSLYCCIMVPIVSYCQKCAQRMHRRSTESGVHSTFDQHCRRVNNLFEQFKIDPISIGKRSYILCVYDDNC
ncbi:hypothetical protein EMCRGX_G004812 [Ephydatia muelleri]